MVHARAEYAELAPFLGLRIAGRRYETTYGILGRQITKSCSGDGGNGGSLRLRVFTPNNGCTITTLHFSLSDS